ncbi:predicted protein [Nematostella vectensis]|uniref:Uncharacterized protein n=1 Tax=Nematostella vectensis TaxID=45351 RepID=A7SLP7_NEMVE|nr:predicted protein [Nematostella vectensis]|eukprot:XP_001627487.1 predicted protein [Nematostella vectensis]
MRAGYHEILYQKEYVIQPENHSWESHGGQGQQYVSRKASTCYSSTSRNMASCFSTTSTGGLASSISPFADTEDPSIIKARNQSKLVACYPEPHRVHLNSYPRQRIIEHNYINEHHANSYHSQHMSDDRQVLNREHSDEGKRLIYVPFNQKFKTEEQVPHERTYIQNIKGNQRTERALYQQDLRDPQPQYNPPFRPQSEKSAYQQIYIESAQTVRAPFEQTVRDFSQHDRTKHASAILENQHVDIHAYKRIVGATQYGGFQYEKNPRETSHANIALYRQSFKESQQEVFPSKQNFREGDIALTEQFSKQSQFANMSSYKQTYYRESPHDMVSYKQPKESTQVVKVMYGKQNFRETPSPDLNPHVAMHYKRKFGETSHTEIPPPKRPLRESQQVDTETHSHSLKECPLPYKRTSRRTQKADMDIDGHVQRESLVQFQQQLRETLGPDPCKLHYRETQHDDIASNEQLLRESPQCESVARKHMPRRSPPAYKPQLKESPKVNRIRDAHLLRPPPPLVRVAEDVPRNTDTSPTLSRRQGFVSHEVSSRKTDVSPIPPSECTFLEGFEEKRIDHYRHHASSVSCAERVSPTKEEMCDLSDVHSQGRRRSIHCILDLTKTSVKEKRKSLCKETAENPHFKKDGFTGNVMSHTSKSESATSMTANHSQSPNITESAITSNCVSTNVLRNSSRSDSTQVTNNGRVSTSRNTALPQPPPLRQLDDRENPSTNADERSPQTCLKRSHSYSEVHEVTKNVSVHRTNSEGSPAQTPKRQPEAVRRGKDGSVEKGHAASCGGYAYDHGTLPIIIAVHSMAMDETGSNVNSKKIWETVLKTATSTLSCSKSKVINPIMLNAREDRTFNM